MPSRQLLSIQIFLNPLARRAVFLQQPCYYYEDQQFFVKRTGKHGGRHGTFFSRRRPLRQYRHERRKRDSLDNQIIRPMHLCRTQICRPVRALLWRRIPQRTEYEIAVLTYTKNYTGARRDTWGCIRSGCRSSGKTDTALDAGINRLLVPPVTAGSQPGFHGCWSPWRNAMPEETAQSLMTSIPGCASSLERHIQTSSSEPSSV